uniref:Uncharacterized protein n=1 Tax=Chenopodium quinoa TaxID=63459 RepID=A0A803KS96_CHEQI
MPADMKDEDWEELDLEARAAIILCLERDVAFLVNDEATAAGVATSVMSSSSGRDYKDQAQGLFATRGRTNERGKGKRGKSRPKSRPHAEKTCFKCGLLEKNGCKIVAENGVMKVVRGSLVVMKAVRNGNLYPLLGNTVTGDLAIGISGSKDHTECTRIWHMRLGHMSEKGLSFLSGQGYPKGVQGYRLWSVEDSKFVISRDVTFDERSMIALSKAMTPSDGDVGKTSNTQVVEIESKDQQIDSSHVQVEHPSATRYEEEDELEHEEIQHKNAHVLQQQQQDSLASTKPKRNYKLVQKFGSNKPLRHYGQLNLVEYALSVEDDEPVTFKQAIRDKDSENWLVAMEEEMQSLHKNKTWEVVPLHVGKTAIGCKWVYKRKEDPTEISGTRFKARSNYDCCVYIRKLHGGDYIYLLLYVDDMLIASKSKVEIDRLKFQLGKEFETKDLGAAKKILGMEIRRDRSSRKLFLSQKGYIERVIEKFGMKSAKSVVTPLAPHSRLSSKQSPTTAKDKAYMDNVPYASAVGSLMYAMVCTRPDISQAVGVVSRFMANLGKIHWEAVKWILRYLKGTIDTGLCFGGDNCQISGSVDSDYAGDLDRRRSTTGYAFMIFGAPVSWRSMLQATVALSTTEAEYMAMTEGVKESLWLRGLLDDLGFRQEGVQLSCDIQSAIHLEKNQVYHARTKHIDVRYHFIRDVVEKGDISLMKVHTDKNPADMLTKVVSGSKFQHCLELLKVIPY